MKIYAFPINKNKTHLDRVSAFKVILNHSTKPNIPTMHTNARVVHIPKIKLHTSTGYSINKEAVLNMTSFALLKIIIRICVVLIGIQKGLAALRFYQNQANNYLQKQSQHKIAPITKNC